MGAATGAAAGAATGAAAAAETPLPTTAGPRLLRAEVEEEEERPLGL